MYYILGLNHYIQYVSKKIENELYIDFVQYISKIVEERDIELIAEEFNEDCLELNHVRHSILQLTSEENSVKHIFMDPVLSTRNSLGLNNGLFESDSAEIIHSRELYWLEQVKEHSDCNILFCMGANHVSTFSHLLEERDKEYIILDPYWHQQDFHKET